MSQRRRLAACAVCTLALASCGGETKQADSPGNCPEGTVLHGSDCVPPGAADNTSSSPSSGPPSKQHKADDDAPRGNTGGDSSPSPSSGPASGKGGYDKDAVEAELKRAARQIQKNCGSATDDEGHATGPWGKTTASVVLGRNGHVKQASVPSPYAGKPVGDCAAHAFEKIQFPPYAGETDVSVDWEVELVQPKHK
jgi:hypothetical protein